MTSEVRPEVVATIVEALATDRNAAEFDQVLDQATGAETHAAAVLLARADVQQSRTRTLLECTLPEVQMLADRGIVLNWLIERLSNRWPPHPHMSLADILKPLDPSVIGHLATRLHRVGMCDLCGHDDGA